MSSNPTLPELRAKLTTALTVLQKHPEAASKFIQDALTLLGHDFMPPRDSRGMRSKLPWRTLVIGESFLVPYEDPLAALAAPRGSDQYNRLYSSAASYKKRLGLIFTLNPTANGYQVTRIA